MKSKIVLALVLFGVLVGPVPGVQKPPNIVGTWTGIMTMADGGNNKLTMEITTAEEGYAGTIRDDEGLMPEGTELEDIELAGEKLTFNVTTPDLAPISFTFTVGLQSLLGRWEDPSNQTNGPVELKRWK